MEQNISYKDLRDKGFSLVEIVVIVAILIVLLAILTPSLLRYTENSRMQKDDSAMDEVCNAFILALSDSAAFDEACAYAIRNNYVTYTDSSGVYGAKYTDEEFWAPDGSGYAVTITFNPDENGTYTLSEGLVNDMTYGNGSIADSRVAENLQQCYFSEMGEGKLYHQVERTIGTTFSEKSATYNNSSYTVFITFEVAQGIKRADVYGEWNGTNLDPSCPASLGSGTTEYTEEKEAIATKPTGGTTQSNYTSSDLQGSGTSGPSGEWPSYKKDDLPCGHKYNAPGNHDKLPCEHYACEEGNHEELGCKHFACENCECVPASCGIEGHWSSDGKDHSKRNSIHSYSGEQHRYNCQCITWTIPEGARFVSYRGQNGKTVWEAGETISCPYTLGDYDKYYYGDYVYAISNGYSPDNGWTVRLNTAVTDKDQETYGPIFDRILGRDVSVMPSTFSGCKNLKIAPEIPQYIYNMEQAFSGCSALEEVPDLSHCVELSSMWSTFSGCTSLTDISGTIIPSTVKNMNDTFASCSNITTGPNMSRADSVTTMRYTFHGCSSLVSPPTISQNAKITNMYAIFLSCQSLKTAPFIPDTVTDLTWAFHNCKSLETLPTIPNSVLSMGNAFANCTSLSGEITINAEPSSYSSCFSSVDFQKQNLTLTGTSSVLDPIGKTGKNYCEECNGKCAGHPCRIEGHVLTDGRDHYSAATCGRHKFDCECDRWVVPEGGTFIMKTAVNGKSIYTAGERLPCNYSLKDYDAFTIGQYRYHISTGYSFDNGWVVKINEEVVDRNQTTYEPILEEIFGRKTRILVNTYQNCKNLVTAPVVPSTIVNMNYAFSGCTSLRGTVIINTNYIDKNTGSTHGTCSGAFAGVNLADVTLAGEAEDSVLDIIGSTGKNYCAECNGKCIDGKLSEHHTTCVGGTATCQNKAICDVCKQEYGTLKSCTGGTATCLKKALCKWCNQEYGSIRSCSGGTSTCQNKAICQWCNREYGSLASHTGGTATCLQKARCKWCNQEYGNLLAHSGGEATCQNRATCSTCNQEYGNLGTHVIENGACVLCGQTGISIETAHNYPNSQNYIVLGTWDYSDAKSVNIIIEYETESTSYDWVSIVSGYDYTAGSSYSQTKEYLNTSGNIVSATGTTSAVKFGGSTRTIKTFNNINMLQGTVIFRSDSSVQKWGAKIIVTPNY